MGKYVTETVNSDQKPGFELLTSWHRSIQFKILFRNCKNNFKWQRSVC